MNTQTLQGNWNVTKGKLKQKYAQLTDSDLVYEEGKEDELIGRIQKRVGASRQEIENFLDSTTSGASPSSAPHEQRRGVAAEREHHVDTPLKRPVPTSATGTARDADLSGQSQQASASPGVGQKQSQQPGPSDRSREPSRPQNTPSSRSPDAADQSSSARRTP